jgi:hypothetical protein
MTPPSDPSDIVTWAKSYPFGHPGESYLFHGGEKLTLEAPAEAVKGRVPVIASGSNAAPRQLARKYQAFDRGASIPVTRAHVSDFDSVYNAHITSYGSVPATLFPSPGTVLETFITWLDDHELDVMHGTEQPGVNYHFSELRNLRIEVEGIGALDAAFAYITVAGCLRHEGGPVSLAEVPARARRYPSRRQPEMQEVIRDLTAPGAPLEPFIRENVENAELRLHRSRALAGSAHPFEHGGMRVIEVKAG